MVSVFGVGNREYYCKQCGYAVCDPCSRNKKFLSKDAKEKFRVCDLCDTKLENIKLRLNFTKFLELKDKKIEITEKLLKKLREQKELMKKEMAAEEIVQKSALQNVDQQIEKEKANQQKFSEQITNVKVEISFTRDK